MEIYLPTLEGKMTALVVVLRFIAFAIMVAGFVCAMSSDRMTGTALLRPFVQAIIIVAAIAYMDVWFPKVENVFMVVANYVSRSSTVQLSRNNQTTRELVVRLTVFAEPKLTLLGHDFACRLQEAVDDKGNSLIPDRARQYNTMTPDPAWRWDVQVNLAQPDNIGTRIYWGLLGRLRGKTNREGMTQTLNRLKAIAEA